MKNLIKLTVNDREVEIAVEPNMTLADFIRYELG
jgi:aerobic-type carbon monoxide dehydrogenase small subunit (CoxS/CutS family)